MVAAVFEADLSVEQARELARLMDEMRPTRPEAVIVATLLYEAPRATLMAMWPSRAAFEAYLATTDMPRGAELMRMVGAEPTMRVVDVLEHA